MKTYLESQEVENLEQAATNLRDRLLISVLFHLGCRVSEALALKVEDIEFINCTVIIQHLKSSFKLSCPKCNTRLGRSHTFCPKCGSKVDNALRQMQEHRKQRVLPVDGKTLEALGEYIKRDGPELRDGKRIVFGINRQSS